MCIRDRKNGTAVISAVMKNGLRAECKITVKIAVDYVQLDSAYKDVYAVSYTHLDVYKRQPAWCC